jgi:thiol:disulfide interchange protein/DsbC/DsbD-like thiol-disulfide interchange protein
MPVFSLASRWLALLLVLGAAPALAQEDTSPYSDAELVSDRAAVRPGETFDVALRMTMDPGWHNYWINPGDAGMPTRIAWELPEGVTAGEIRWPYPKWIEVPPYASYAYEDEVLLLTAITVPEGFSASTLDLRAEAEWLICEDVCLPASESVALSLPVRDAPAEDPRWAPALAEARAALPAALPEGWSAAGEATEDGYALRLAPAAGWEGSFEGVRFFPYEKGVIRHAAAQPLLTGEEGVTFTLARSEFARGTPERLAGVLVASEGATWVGGARAVEVDVPLAGGVASASSASAGAGGLGAGAPITLLLALGLAFVGGLILNLMPCVFPILSIKILGFADGRAHERGLLRKHGLLFGAGVLVSFWALAAGLIALRAGGESLGWGFQLQSPGVVAFLAVLMFAIGLNLLGVFEIGGRLAGATAGLDRKGGASGAFLSGVLATIVATPCTAPFMGAALGWALAQPAAAALAVFTALGVGMATPYVTLSLFPAWMARLPRPGPWMETLKQVLSFGLFATAVWLVWVFGLQTGIDGVALLLGALTLVAFAAWVLGRWQWTTTPPRLRLMTRGIALGAVLLAGMAVAAGSRQAAPMAAGGDAWEPFRPAAVEEHLSEGRPVFVDFTAAWCLSCQVNKRVALTVPSVERAFEERGVARIRADWTHRDPAITAALESFGRSGVPLYVLYPGAGQEPILLPEILTPGIVLAALDRVGAAPARSTPVARTATGGTPPPAAQP